MNFLRPRTCCQNERDRRVECGVGKRGRETERDRGVGCGVGKRGRETERDRERQRERLDRERHETQRDRETESDTRHYPGLDFWISEFDFQEKIGQK